MENIDKLKIAVEYLEAIAEKSNDSWACIRAMKALELIKAEKR